MRYFRLLLNVCILFLSLVVSDRVIQDVTKQEYEIFLLQRVGYLEARGEGCDGIRAVMHVVDNRVTAGWGNYTHVITAHNQFSSMSVLGDSQTIVWPIWEDPIFSMCGDLADKVYGHTDPDLTNGALYYYNPATATSQWFMDNIATRPKVATIGHHVFFK